MDTAGDDWAIEPVGNGVFNIVRADSATCLLGYRPGTDCRVDTDLTGADNPDKGQHYRYPHDYPNHYTPQQYLPDAVRDSVYYHFGDNKNEQAFKAYWDNIKPRR